MPLAGLGAFLLGRALGAPKRKAEREKLEQEKKRDQALADILAGNFDPNVFRGDPKKPDGFLGNLLETIGLGGILEGDETMEDAQNLATQAVEGFAPQIPGVTSAPQQPEVFGPPVPPGAAPVGPQQQQGQGIGLPEILADPTKLMAVGELLGNTNQLLGLGRLSEQKRSTDLREQEFEFRMNKPVPVEVSDGQGGTITTFMSPVQMMRQGPEGAILKNLAPVDTPMVLPSQLNALRNDKGETPPIGTTPRQAMAQGFKAVTPTAEAASIGLDSTLKIVNRLDTLTDKIFKAESPFARYLEAPGAMLGIKLQTNPDAVLFQSLKEGILANIVRTFGERGTLTDNDIQRARALLPELIPVPDSRTVAKDKLKQIKELISEIDQRTTGRKKATKTGTLPDAARQKLKEGVKTRFGNGQVWTLQNGVEVRLE